MGGTSRAARFQISGPKNSFVLVTLPVGSVTVTATSGGGTTTMRNFTSNPAAGVLQLNNQGNLNIDVGATIDIKANQSASTYSGDFTVSAIAN